MRGDDRTNWPSANERERGRRAAYRFEREADDGSLEPAPGTREAGGAEQTR